ncbi:unnamed protein product [Anisakis simplex]|uniref:Transcriptional regulator ATRX homolog (inferred by orthology to a C. elegans protein) n=1 Tax=Anisakis simplex TaxID=6269 RepID=A0A0M3K2D4_ANISI|nr:unnamed protein product [Anisakis simplex]
MAENSKGAVSELQEDASEDDGGGVKSDVDAAAESVMDSDSELNSLIRSCRKELNKDDNDGGGEQASSNATSKTSKTEKSSTNKSKSKTKNDYGPEYMYEYDEEDSDGGEQCEANEENNTAESSEKSNDETKDEPEKLRRSKRGGGGGGSISTEQLKKESKKAKLRKDCEEVKEESIDGNDNDSEEHDEVDEESPVVIKRSKIDKLLAKRLDLSDSEEEGEREMEKDANERSEKATGNKSKKNKKKEYATRSTMRQKRKKKRARIEEDDSSDGTGQDASDIDSDIVEVESASDDDNKNDKGDESAKKRRGAKAIMGKNKLTKETVDAEKAERERRKRIEAKQKEFNGIELVQGSSANDLASALTESSTQPIRLKNVVLDRDEHSDEPCPVSVHQSLVKCLKKHQAEGIQFLYNCTIESLQRLNKDEGGGAILAHCMGLGKTLQVIAFLHTIMMHPKISQKVKRVLVVVPKNVVLNWFKEFEKWLDNDNVDRDLDTINTWFESDEPSVMIIGYDMFRILTRDEDDNSSKSKKNDTKRKPSKQARRLMRLQPDFRKFLQDPGPDLIVCDEAHKLKNDESALTKTMKKIQTKRRICLTGTPLQNNLMEYHCMVSFVKQGLLGTKHEFSNRFANIINRGRLKDATAAERVDYRVLMDSIPPKQEYVINVRLTPKQVKLYRCFLERVGQDSTGLSKRLLPDYHILSRIWTHPHQLLAHEIVVERKRLLEDDKEDLEEFIDDGEETPSVIETSDDDVVALDDLNEENGDDDAVASTSKLKNSDAKATRKSKRLAGEEDSMDDSPPTPPEFRGWYAKTGLVSAEDENDFNLSNKLLLLVAIIKKCEEIGDKLMINSSEIDRLLRDIILSHQDAIVNYLQHDSLFEDIEEEKLTEQECQEAWEDYEREKTMAAPIRGVYLPYEHQLAADQNHIMMMAKKMNDNNQMLYRLQTDEIFVQAFTVTGMEQDVAMKLAYMKISLDSLLPHMPAETRGAITGFGVFFSGLIKEINREKQTPRELMDRALRTFRQVVELTRHIPACQPLLRHLYRSSNQFFDPTRPAP